MSEHFFRNNYNDSREQFLSVGKSAGGMISSYSHPSDDKLVPGGVSVDLVRFGEGGQNPVIFVISGVHGTEMNVGSGVQRGFIEGIGQGDIRLNGVTLVFVHAINPVGSARVSRVNEDNIDLNRNFVDFSRPLPINNEYPVLHDALCPTDWEGDTREVAARKLQTYLDNNGMDKLLSRVLKGQYTHKQGLFYGGTKTSWSAETMRHIVGEHVAEATQAAIFDIHSGVGPKGYGDIYDFTDGSALSSVVDGMSGQLVHVLDYFPQLKTRIKHLIEFGTLPFTEVLDALQADNWLMHYGDLNSPRGREIKNNLYHALNIDEPEWRERIWKQGRDGILALIKQLSAP